MLARELLLQLLQLRRDLIFTNAFKKQKLTSGLLLVQALASFRVEPNFLENFQGVDGQKVLGQAPELGLYICACIYICICTHTHVHTYTYIYIYIYIAEGAWPRCIYYTHTHTHNTHTHTTHTHTGDYLKSILRQIAAQLPPELIFTTPLGDYFKRIPKDILQVESGDF